MNPKAVASDPQRHPKYEPLYDVDPCTGATIEIFFADHVFAGMKGAGWFHWTCKPGLVPDWPPNGPFATSYSAYRDALGSVE
jgi:hypothetical protein